MIIKIFGGPAEGKSTVAKLLENFLLQQGFEVESHDHEAKDDKWEKEKFEKNLTIMKEAAHKGDSLKVEIKTILYQRETLPQYALEFKSKKETDQ